VGLAALLLVVVGGALIVLLNPRHRSFYTGAQGGAATSPAAAPRGTPPTPGRPADVDGRPQGSSADPLARIRIPLAQHMPKNLPAPGIPPGWDVKEFVGRAAVELLRTDDSVVLRLRSERSSYALHRNVMVDPREHPFVSWSWKVTRVPTGGDVRLRTADDQAAQIYVVFPRWPSPQTSSDVIGYVWDTTAPVGTTLTSTKAGNVKVVVVESGSARLGTWQHHERNVATDYVELFGRQPPRVGKLAVMIDADDTRSEAEALIRELAFSATRSEGRERPTSMLR
jgi:hypothetical protein